MEKKANVVGDTIGGYCAKCKAILPHTVLTVRNDTVGKATCNTCKESHKFQPNRPLNKVEKALARKAATAARREELRKASFDEALSHFNLDDARLYNLAEGGYQINDLINHSMFGYGIVEEIEGYNKMSVRFREGSRRFAFNHRI